MTVAEETADVSAKRFTLVRLTVAWPIASSDWTAYTAGSVYYVDLPEVAVVGAGYSSDGTTELVAVSSIGAVSTDKYYWDETNRRLYVGMTSAATRYVDVWLHFTSGQGRYSSDNPGSSATGTRFYRPMLLTTPGVGQSSENANLGIMESGSDEIEIARFDPDGTDWTVDHLGTGKTFLNRDVYVWSFIGSLDNCIGCRVGRIRTAKHTRSALRLSFYDWIGALGDPAYMGDTAATAFVRNSEFESLRAADIDKPLPYVAGRLNYAKFTRYGMTDQTGWLIQEGQEAICTEVSDYSALLATWNRNWLLCRIPTGGLTTKSASAVVAYEKETGTKIWHIQCATHNLICGDVISWLNDHLGLVVYCSPHTYNGTAYNIIVISDTSATVPSAFTTYSKPTLLYHATDGSTYVIDPRDITVTQETLDSGNKRVSVSLTDTTIRVFEIESGELATMTSLSTLSPGQGGRLTYQIEPAASSLHGTVVQRILEGAGIDVDSASISTANTALAIKTRFTIPNVGETSYRNTRDYLGELLKATGGAVRVTSAGEMEYILLPDAAEVAELSTREVQGLEVTDDVSDYIAGLTFQNQHDPEPGGAFNDIPDDGTNDPVYTPQYTYGSGVNTIFRVASTEDVNHYLEWVSQGTIITDVFALRNSVRRKWSFRTKYGACNARPGDKIVLTDSLGLGDGEESVDLLVIGVENRDDEVAFTAVEAI